MSVVTSRNGVYYDDIIDSQTSVEDFMEKHFHRLVRVIRPINFYSWLRQCTVFTQDDQEEVEFTYHTNSMKAGCLIDIIKRKGKAGFVAFMEVVEYSYPELFVEITGKKARPPPEEFSITGNPVLRNQSRRVRTENHLSALAWLDMGKLTSSLMQTLASKKEQLNQLEELMRNMQINQLQLEEENASYYDQLQDAAEVKETLSDQIKRLEEHVQDLERDLKQTTEQCNKLRLEKDKFESQYIQMMVANSAKEHIPVSASVSTAAAIDANERRPNSIKATFHSCKNYHKSTEPDISPSSPQINWQTQTISELRALNDELKQKKEEITLENDELRQQINELTAKLCVLQSNSDRILHSYNDMRSERDQFSEKCTEIEKKFNDEKTKTEKLMTECQMFEERFRRMDETIQTLKKEIEQSKSQVAAGKSVLHGIVSSVLNPHEGAFHDFDYTAPKEPKVKEGTATLRRVQQNATTGTGRFELAKRQASILRAQPLFVYAPNEVSRSVFDALRDHYDTCQYDVIANDPNVFRQLAEKGIVDQIPLPDGKYRIITVESVKQYQQKAREHAILMPALPPSCIAVLQKKGFEPIVVVIKVESDSQYAELSAIEESLDRYKVSKYDVVLVETNIAADSSKFGDYVLKKIGEYILKLGFSGAS